MDEAKLVPPSVREALLRHLPSRQQIGNARIILAEEATKALPGKNFPNLLDIEEHLAAVVDGIILVVESAGSICELGSFVKIPDISRKLIVVVSSAHNGTPSFVKLGALDYFVDQSRNEERLISFHWDTKDEVCDIKKYVLTDMTDDINAVVSKQPLNGHLRLSDLGDRIFFTLSLCHLLRGAKMTELRECYNSVLPSVSNRELLKHLSILEICGLIRHVDHGRKARYFVPLIDAIPLKVAFVSGAEDRDRDTMRWIRDISKLIAESDPTRMAIFQEHQNGT